jgi:hypothetical protein
MSVGKARLVDRIRKKRKAYTILIEEPLRKYQFGGTRSELDYKIRIDFWRTS